MRAGGKMLRELQREFRPGYTLERAGGTNAKHKVYGPDGRPVRLPDGRPLVLANSPHTGGNALAVLRRILRSAGVIA